MPEARGAGAGVLAVLAKAPIAGFAKTRLIPRLGAEGAAALHADLVRRTLASATGAGFEEVALWCAPSSAHPFFGSCLRLGPLALHDQPAGDLGLRMRAALETGTARGEPTLLVGTDCPSLSPARLREAREALGPRSDAVFVPALDGGYALVGLRRVHPALFAGVPWGTPAVMAETRTRLAALGWRWTELDPVRDIDTPEDLEWLLERSDLPSSSAWKERR